MCVVLKCTFCAVGCFSENFKAPRNNVIGNARIQNVISAYDCQVKHCRITDDCKYFAYIKNDRICYLKTANAHENLQYEERVVFGPRTCKSKYLFKENIVFSFEYFFTDNTLSL